MKKLHIIIYLAFTCGTSIAQKKVSVSYAKDFDLSVLKTFDFSESSYNLGQKFKKQPYVAKVLIENLSKKGVQKTEGESDAIVDVSIGFRKIINVNKYPRHYSAGIVYTRSLEEEKKACLVISII